MRRLRQYLTVTEHDIQSYPRANRECPVCGRTDEFRVRPRLIRVYFCLHCRFQGFLFPFWVR